MNPERLNDGIRFKIDVREGEKVLASGYLCDGEFSASIRQHVPEDVLDCFRDMATTEMSKGNDGITHTRKPGLILNMTRLITFESHCPSGHLAVSEITAAALSNALACGVLPLWCQECGSVWQASEGLQINLRKRFTDEVTH